MMWIQPVQLLRIAGVLAFALTAWQYWLVRVYGRLTAPITLLELALDGVVSRDLFLVLEQASIWTLAVLLWRGTRLDELRPRDTLRVRLVALQVVLASVSAGDLLPLVAVQVGLLLPGRAGRFWILCQSGLQLAICSYVPGALSWMQPTLLVSIDGTHAWLLSYLSIPTYHLLAYSLGMLGAVEAEHRRELGVAHAEVLRKNRELHLLNAELQATRQMEAESARVAERVTIARELHDALGHHLAALSVNLQLATRLEGKEARKSVEDAYLLARMLLSDVRHVVTDLRQLDAASLRRAIETMAASIVRPRVTVEFDPALDGIGPLPGHTLFRCAQEAITNTLRHAEAENLSLRLERTPRGYRFSARDDGRGALDLFYGHGLTGMRERVEELGGLMRCESRPGAGFTLEVEVPEKAVAA